MLGVDLQEPMDGFGFQPGLLGHPLGCPSRRRRQRHPNAFGWKSPRTSSKSDSRKAASAMIAKIPLPLSQHIAAMYLQKGA